MTRAFRHKSRTLPQRRTHHSALVKSEHARSWIRLKPQRECQAIIWKSMTDAASRRIIKQKKLTSSLAMESPEMLARIKTAIPDKNPWKTIQTGQLTKAGKKTRKKKRGRVEKKRRKNTHKYSCKDLT